MIIKSIYYSILRYIRVNIYL